MKISELKCSLLPHVQIIEFLNTLSNDEVIPSREIEEKLQLSLNSGSIHRHARELKDYYEPVLIEGRRTKVWGNKKAIAAVRRQQHAYQNLQS